MSLGRKALAHLASRLATARCDQRESADASSGESPNRPAKRFGLATLLQVPVGYEDELGFHCGQPQVETAVPGWVMEPDNLPANIKSI
jgi:hypothetical protein